MPGSWSQESYIEAYRFAASAHWNPNHRQVVPGTQIPYLMHLSFVAMEVMAALAQESDLDGDLAVQCALLHDTLEDTNVSFEQLAHTFGQAVAAGVAALTKDAAMGEYLAEEERKKIQMADSLRRITAQPMEIWMVKMADRIANLQPPPAHWSAAKAAGYLDEAIEIHRVLKPASRFLSDRLEAKIKAYPALSVHSQPSRLQG